MKTPLTPRFFRGAALCLIWPAWLQAHPGHAHVFGFGADSVHSVAGFDYVPALVAIGLWTALLGGRVGWALFLRLVGAMAAAWGRRTPASRTRESA